MRNFKVRMSKLEKDIKTRKKLYKIYWVDGRVSPSYLYIPIEINT